MDLGVAVQIREEKPSGPEGERQGKRKAKL